MEPNGSNGVAGADAEAKRSLSVVIVVDWFLRYASEQAVGLRRAGADVTLVCRDHALEFRGDNSERAAVLDAACEAGVRVLILGGRVSRARGWLSAAGLRRVLSTRPIDVVHAHLNQDHRLLLLAWALRRPVVLTVHDPEPHPGQPELRRLSSLVHRLWIRTARSLVVHGERLRETAERLFPGASVAVMPHGLSPEPTPYAIPGRPLILLFGRLEPYKGISILMRAMPEVWSHRPEARVVIAGEGPAASEITLDDPRIEAKTRYIPDAELEQLFRAASVVVAPYVEGSQSGVLALAAARGIPVVVTDVGALPELAPNASLVVPPRDHDALAKALVEALDHDARFRDDILLRARTELSWSAVADRSLSLYRSITAA